MMAKTEQIFGEKTVKFTGVWVKGERQ